MTKGPDLNNLVSLLALGAMLGFVSTFIFLGLAFLLLFKINGPRWSYVAAAGGAGLAHFLIGLMWAHSNLQKPLLDDFRPARFFFSGFLLELSQPEGWGYLAILGAKLLGGLCAGCVFVILAPSLQRSTGANS